MAKKPDKASRIRQAADAVATVRRRYTKLIKNLLPPLTAIRWRRGDNVVKGTVLHTADDRVFVSSYKSGKSYWINAYDIVNIVD